MIKFRTLAGAAVASSALILGLAGTAGAQVNGDTPTPAITQQGHHRHHFLRPEQFDVIIADNLESRLSVNDVSALGPVFIHQGRDNTLSDVLDQFADGRGNNVNVDHPALGLPSIDRRVCEATITQTDAPWRFRGGDGLFRRAFGFGVYNLTAQFSFRLDRHGRCSLGNLSPEQVRGIVLAAGGSNVQSDISTFCRRHHIPTPVLLADDIFVQGTGVASLPRIPRPLITPTVSISAI